MTVIHHAHWKTEPAAEPLAVRPYHFADVPLDTINGAGIGLLEGHAEVAFFRNSWRITEIWIDAWDGNGWVDRKAPPSIQGKLTVHFLSDKKWCRGVDADHLEVLEEATP